MAKFLNSMIFIILIFSTLFYSFNTYSNPNTVKVLQVKGNRAVLLLPKNYKTEKGKLLKINNNSYGKILNIKLRKVLVLLFDNHNLKQGDTFSLPELTINFFELNNDKTPLHTNSSLGDSYFFQTI